MNKVYGFPSYETEDIYPKFGIMSIKKGDCLRGYRVVYMRSPGHFTFKGSMQFTLENARRLRQFYIDTHNPAVTSFEIVE
jgi:hypothetical protein